MNLPFARQPYLYSTTDFSMDAQHMYVVSEAGIQSYSQQFFVVTQKNFKLFTLKKNYTGAQVITPASEKTLDFINMINMYVPIAAYVIHNQNYKFAEHVRLMNAVLEDAIKILPTRINPSQLSDQVYINSIAPVLENVLNSFKRFSTAAVHVKDVSDRKSWLNEQLKGVMSLFRKVYNKAQKANLVTITVSHLTLNTTHLTQDEIERKISIQVQQIVCELLHENEQGVFHLFHKSYRELSGTYYTQIFVLTDQNFVLTTNSIALDPNQSVDINSVVNQVTYMFRVNVAVLDVHGLDGIDQNRVKQEFQQYLSSHQYLYYKSKEISPDIIIVK